MTRRMLHEAEVCTVRGSAFGESSVAMGNLFQVHAGAGLEKDFELSAWCP